MEAAYDILVAGLGAMGSSTLFHLAKSGRRVAGIEQFSAAHDRGSSHGDTRIIRKAYFLHPDYVPLLHRSYELWRELEGATGQDLLVLTGLLCIGRDGSPFVEGLERTFAQHKLPHEKLTPDETMRRYPAFRIPEDASVHYDPDGGYLKPEDCIRSHLKEARRLGAKVHEHELLLHWQPDGEGVTVVTSQRTIRADRLILTTGAWVIPEFAALGIPLTIRRKVLFWHKLRNPAALTDTPVFIWKTDGGDFYGFPSLDGMTMKSAEDSGGSTVEIADQVERDIFPEDEATLRQFLVGAFGPDQITGVARAKTCLYTLTADKNFLMDFHPEHPQVVMASCCSGHGFKLSSAIGEILAGAASTGEFPRSVDFLRFASGKPPIRV